MAVTCGSPGRNRRPGGIEGQHPDIAAAGDPARIAPARIAKVRLVHAPAARRRLAFAGA
jgi:hypothetical protein